MKIFIGLEEYPYSILDVSCRSVFIIGNNKISILSSINYWSMEDYKKHWHDALNYFKSHEKTCFIDSIESDKDKPSWTRALVLYKKNNNVIIQRIYLENNDKKTFITNLHQKIAMVVFHHTNNKKTSIAFKNGLLIFLMYKI